MSRFLAILCLSFCVVHGANGQILKNVKNLLPLKKHEEPPRRKPQARKIIVVDSVTGKAEIITQAPPPKQAAAKDTIQTKIQFNSKTSAPAQVAEKPAPANNQQVVKPVPQVANQSFTLKSGKAADTAVGDKSSKIKLDLQPQGNNSAGNTVYYSPRYNYNAAVADSINKAQSANINSSNPKYPNRYGYTSTSATATVKKQEPPVKTEPPAEKKETPPEKPEIFIEDTVREPIVISLPKNQTNYTQSNNFPRTYSSVEKKKHNSILVIDDGSNVEEEDYADMTLSYPRLSVEIRLVQAVVRDINELKFFVTITNNSARTQKFLFDRPLKKGFAIWGASCRINGSNSNNVLSENGKPEYNVKTFSSAKYDKYAITIKPFEWFIKKFSVADIVVLNDEVCKGGKLPEDRYTLQLIFQGNYSNVVSFTVRR